MRAKQWIKVVLRNAPNASMIANHASQHARHTLKTVLMMIAEEHARVASMPARLALVLAKPLVMNVKGMTESAAKKHAKNAKKHAMRV